MRRKRNVFQDNQTKTSTIYSTIHAAFSIDSDFFFIPEIDIQFPFSKKIVMISKLKDYDMLLDLNIFKWRFCGCGEVDTRNNFARGSDCETVRNS